MGRWWRGDGSEKDDPQQWASSMSGRNTSYSSGWADDELPNCVLPGPFPAHWWDDRPSCHSSSTAAEGAYRHSVAVGAEEDHTLIDLFIQSPSNLNYNHPPIMQWL